MNKEIYEAYLKILRSELIPALGCTEPIAIAYAAAKARETLGCKPTSIQMECSGNIIKNVKGVTVPNSGGLKGIEVAAVLGVLGGDASRQLEVLQAVRPGHIEEAKKLLAEGYCKCELIKGEENLYIIARAFAGEDEAVVEIKTKHTHITRISKNGKNLFEQNDIDQENSKSDVSLLNIKDIIEFADTVELNKIQDLLEAQITTNYAISEEGLKNQYGAQVGKTLLEFYGNDVKVRAKARAAAGSDARMSGSAMPVIINSGSGNQGMTVSLPVIEYANELKVPREKLYRALIISNLTAIYQKKYIGRLSAYCGAVSAACGSGAGITYLYGGGYEEISKTIVNTIANVGGIVCDGAKPSCAAKIASSVDAAIMGHYMGSAEKTFQPGDGLVKSDVDQTIESIGRMGREGMKSTDIEILEIMIK